MTLHDITTYYQSLPHFAPQQVNSTEDMFSLKNLEDFLDVIHHPEKDLFLIHVAGTNGKGSTVAFLQSALTYSLLHDAAEFDAKIDHPMVGTFTSPFLVSPLEMYRMDGAIIEEAVYISVMEKLINIRESLPEEKRPSEYEMYTAAALCIFKELGCEFSILEVCMGGRLDATNVIPAPKVSVLTPIQYDHMEILGNTLTEIAREKCGILKPGTVCITAPQDPEAMDVIIDCCKELDIPLVESVPLDIKGLEAEFCGDAPVHEMTDGVGDAGGVGVVDKAELHFKMRGNYQEINAGTAASAALMCLRRLLGAGHTIWASRESEDKAQTNPVILDATLHTII
jgi:folylpolyglutamate synthase/dihydrofolate synthase